MGPVEGSVTESAGRRQPAGTPAACERSPLGTFPECPLCGGTMAPEHAHERCTSCGWRDSCCD